MAACGKQLHVQAWAKGSSYEACVEATAGPDDGTVLRAPTEKQGLIPLCKDTFLGKVGYCAVFTCCCGAGMKLTQRMSHSFNLSLLAE